jgi:hypothetical protein
MRMLDRINSIQSLVPDMVFWYDRQSLDSGVKWREEIENAITASDIFLLFWSVFAKHSSEVKKEWMFALENKGLDCISPVPLDPPELCPPPKELDELCFDDRRFSVSEKTKGVRFFGLNQHGDIELR